MIDDDPVKAEAHDSVEEDLGDEDEEAEPTAGARRHAVVVMFAMYSGESHGGFVAVSSPDESSTFSC